MFRPHKYNIHIYCFFIAIFGYFTWGFVLFVGTNPHVNIPFFQLSQDILIRISQQVSISFTVFAILIKVTFLWDKSLSQRVQKANLYAKHYASKYSNTKTSIISKLTKKERTNLYNLVPASFLPKEINSSALDWYLYDVCVLVDFNDPTSAKFAADIQNQLQKQLSNLRIFCDSIENYSIQELKNIYKSGCKSCLMVLSSSLFNNHTYRILIDYALQRQYFLTLFEQAKPLDKYLVCVATNENYEENVIYQEEYFGYISPYIVNEKSVALENTIDAIQQSLCSTSQIKNTSVQAETPEIANQNKNFIYKYLERMTALIYNYMSPLKNDNNDQVLIFSETLALWLAVTPLLVSFWLATWITSSFINMKIDARLLNWKALPKYEILKKENSEIFLKRDKKSITVLLKENISIKQLKNKIKLIGGKVEKIKFSKDLKMKFKTIFVTTRTERQLVEIKNFVIQEEGTITIFPTYRINSSIQILLTGTIIVSSKSLDDKSVQQFAERYKLKMLQNITPNVWELYSLNQEPLLKTVKKIQENESFIVEPGTIRREL
ncbi:hypothetical protein [Candidatus Uabimicrobium amorphum]|uniref:Uncharacterized protein n=1 Tax=Uabimicrobium amorphum TaxID=2596890 RepID=A0A5S9IR56_UABAM|nr:hypothetical protein [Candidatus Uabimicrobium amorphum]BBM86569.1 hypothetical protein UABAM_04955 [Candidatus Uabimicrobium amorphum]